ncbi:MAG TPA: S41 family peptidase [Longimicrobiales bacterium]|nr:S41 family peptidase [Longimicrobiales bacterium]
MLKASRPVAVGLALLAVLALDAGAQAAPFDAKVRAAVIDSLAARLVQYYVDADTARLIGQVLRTQLRDGAYDTLATPARFAEVVTRHLRAINNDRHLGLQAPAGGRPGVGLSGGATPAQQNFGLTRVEVLPGNVGYLEISAFQGAPGHAEAVASALRVLAGTDALIIDVRRNGGGSGQMSHLVFSHFLPEKPIETIRVVNRSTGTSSVRQSMAEVPGPRRTEVPLYVLTSQGTASAAEEFTFVLKNQKRATIVGDRTAGAGHMVNGYPLGHGFTARISITRVTDAGSGLEWEGAGVQPDLRSVPEQALELAHATAVRRIAARTDNAVRRRTLELIAESLDAARNRTVVIDAPRLQQLAGIYDEGRSVELRAGRLWLRRRPEVMADELIPLGPDRFAVSGAQRVSFEQRGNLIVLTLELPDGTRLSYAKQR